MAQMTKAELRATLNQTIGKPLADLVSMTEILKERFEQIQNLLEESGAVAGLPTDNATVANQQYRATWDRGPQDTLPD
ncbi:hypothetical protein [Halomonas sp.]|uniref:hypothetical protein n=1 Tax=Halomonas sp. TaxID=1486246 RepID=UPI003A92CDA8